jgi:putative transposase
MNPKSKNKKKVTLKIQKLYKRWTDLRTDYIKKTVNEIIKFHPVEVKVEDLNVSGMLKNRKLARAISEQCFYMFRNLLEIKCKQHGIKFTIINRWYPSSKTCSHCGNVNEELKLSERTYHCSKCGISIDRDINASINIQNYA